MPISETIKALNLRTLVTEVCRHIGSSWTVVPERHPDEPNTNYTAIYESSTGKIIDFWLDQYRGMITVGGDFPKDVKGQEHAPHERFTIKVNPGRSAEAIAKDVLRRFVPTYDQQFAEQVKIRVSYDASYALEDSTREAIEEAIGKEFGKQYNSDKDHRRSVCFGGRGGYAFEVKMNGSGGSVKLELDFDAIEIDDAIAVIALLKKRGLLRDRD